MARRKFDPADAEVVNRFLREAVRELWAGSIKVVYSPEWEDPSEPASYSFLYKGIYVDVVVRSGQRPWAQVEFENIDDLGAPIGTIELLFGAVSAPERQAEQNKWTKDESAVTKASWDAYHKRKWKGAEKLIRRAMEA